MSIGRSVPLSLPERVRATYERGLRASLVPHSSLALAVREWLKAHPRADPLEAEAEVMEILGSVERAGV
jgi:hypothetical protein